MLNGLQNLAELRGQVLHVKSDNACLPVLGSAISPSSSLFGSRGDDLERALAGLVKP